MNDNEDIQQDAELQKLQKPCCKKKDVQKAIPFSFELGFLTLSVKSEVLEKINRHCFKNLTGNNGNARVEGICFGSKIDSHIEIEESFEFGYSKDENIITDGRFYKTNSAFLGIYSNGNIPDDSDVNILQQLSRSLKRSIFLIKFNWSGTLNNSSPTIFENVFDICKTSWIDERLICTQVYSHPPHEGLIKNVSENSRKIFYLTFYGRSIEMEQRYESDITDEQRVKMNENREIYKIRPGFNEHKHVFFKLAEDEGWTYQDFQDDQKDYVKMAEEFCRKSKVELRFTFCIPLIRKEKVICLAEILTCRPSSSALSIEGSQRLAAKKFLKSMTMKDSINKAIEQAKSRKKR